MRLAAQTLLLAIGLVFLLALTAAVQAASPACQPRGVFEIGLKVGKYREQLIGADVIDGSGAVLLYFNPETKTFSILATQGQLTCFIAAGKGWTAIEPAPVKSGKDM